MGKRRELEVMHSEDFSLTNLLNPKIEVMYLSPLPHFINPANGSILG